MKFLANNRVSSLREVLLGNIQFARKWFLPLQQSEINNTRLFPEMQRELIGKLLLDCSCTWKQLLCVRLFWDTMAAIQPLRGVPCGQSLTTVLSLFFCCSLSPGIH